MKNRFAKHRPAAGFTLVELMITLVVIAILTAVVVPSYQNQVRKGHRTDAVGAISSILNGEERYYADNVTYTNELAKLGMTVTGSGSSAYVTTDDGRYHIVARACTGMTLTQCVEVEAVAQGSQVNDGNLIANTLGRAVRVLPDTTEVSW